MATFNGTTGNNAFSGTAANDVFNYGNVTYSGNTVVAGRGMDTISSGGGFDRLSFANLGSDYVDVKRIGNDLLIHIQPIADWDDPATTALGGVKITNFYAANGNGVIDRIDFADAYVLSTYSAGIWRALIYNPADVLMFTVVDGSAGNDSLVGTAVGDEIGGFGGNDTLSGLAGDDELEGDDGNDRLFGGAGNDELDGDAGNDLLDGGAGNDELEGGSGIDTVSYSGANGGVNIDLQYGTASGLGATNVGSDQLSGIERAIGGRGNDRLFGSAQANLLNGGAGNDLLVGNAGNDSLLGGAGSDFFEASAASGVIAGQGNDTIDGGAVTDRINYLDGNTLSYFSSGAPVRVNLHTGLASDGAGGTDTLRNISFVRGSAFNDTFTGRSGVGTGFEMFYGNGGNDRIDGGAIVDTLNGTDFNRASYNQLNAAVRVDLQAGTATGQGSDVLIHINQVRGSNLADTIRGSNRSDVVETIEGVGGNDLLDGRGGSDWVRYGYATQGVNVNLVSGVGNAGSGDVDTLLNFEGIRGSNYNDTLTGGKAANNALEFFRGMGGNDTINGGAGYDRVDYVDAVQGVVVTLGGIAAGSAKDGQAILGGQIVAAGTAGATIGTDRLLNIEAVRGSDFNDTLTGSNIATQETFEGRKGNDLIDGRGGLDRAGYHQATSAVTVTLGLAGAAGTAADGYGTKDTLRNIENVQGSRDFSDRITGNELANVIDGQGGNDTLSGGIGNDSLLGGNGNDQLSGGNGNDTLVGGRGNDALTGGNGNDLLVGGAGNDTLNGGAGVDQFRFSASLSATANVDRISGFVAADDTLQLDDAVFVGIGAAGALAPSAFRAGAAAADASDRVIYNSATGQMFYDADGSGTGAQLLFATVAVGTSLSAADYLII